MTMNTALFNTVVAEAMEEITGVWDADLHDAQERRERYEAEMAEYHADVERLYAIRNWLVEHVAEREAEEYQNTLDFYSDYYKDVYGVRPYGLSF